jgi:precorrin-3B synthase
MSLAMAIEVKGWCPGILQPMQSGDGLIVRVRPRGGAFALTGARALADLAARLGNGHVDLTRRANLQLRGLSERALPELQQALGRLGLVDADAEVEAVRNVMVAPLARTMRPVAEAIERTLVEDRRLRSLPAKFGVLVDEGGPLSIAGERADVALLLVGGMVAVGIDAPEGTRWLGMCRRRVDGDASVPGARAGTADARSAGPRPRRRRGGAGAEALAARSLRDERQAPARASRRRSGHCRTVRPARGRAASPARRSRERGGGKGAAPVAVALGLHRDAVGGVAARRA